MRGLHFGLKLTIIYLGSLTRCYIIIIIIMICYMLSVSFVENMPVFIW